MKFNIILLFCICSGFCRPAGAQRSRDMQLKPVILGSPWRIAGSPDLGKFSTTAQQPVDFGIWQAADSSWQLWSCVRGLNIGGNTRLFYHWQGGRLTDTAWKPMGIAMESDPGFGETRSGLQAPFVLKRKNSYLLFYGDWEHICLAEGVDGKTFARQFHEADQSGMFGEGPGNNTRDPMVIRVGGEYYCYYTAYPDKQGSVYLRTSKDLKEWSASRIVAQGGQAGSGMFSAECPFVYFNPANGYYYLFRTQRYGEDAQTSVYQSKDPGNFGINDDRYFVCSLPVAAPEILSYQGQIYIAYLLPSLQGIQISRLAFEKK